MHMLESIGYRIVSRFLPNVTASAKPCACDAGSSWCQSPAVRCTCWSDCQGSTCICPINGCR